MKRIALSAALVALLVAGPASAAPATGSDTKMEGGGIPRLDETPPEARNPADTTGSIAESGRRKPPGAALGAESGTSQELERRSREIDRQIRTGICRGC